MKTATATGEDAAAHDALMRQALDWLRRLTLREASEADVQAFRQWVQASPAHQSAYRDAKALWDTFKPSAGVMSRASPSSVAAYARAQRRRLLRRRAFLGAAAASAAGVAVAVLHPPFDLWVPPSDWGADYRTAAGEQRTLALADGVDVVLNTRTSVSRRMEDGRTVGIGLLAGETAIDLHGARRFEVWAGAGRSVAETGQFEVRYVGSKVCVTCLGGAVRVEHPAGTHVLQARQQTVYDAQDLAGVAAIDLDTVSAWRRGLMIFDRTRLADVVDEINRYRSGRVVLLNDALRDKPVSGHFQTAAPDRAIAQLQYMFNLQTRSLGGILLLS